MAEAIFNHLADTNKMTALSCGIYCDSSSPINEKAKTVLSEIGIEANHISTPVSESLIKDADMVICMTESYRIRLLDLFPQYREKISTMPRSISDPYGCSIDVYRDCRDMILECLKYILNVISGDDNG